MVSAQPSTIQITYAALGVLLVSCVPNVIRPLSGGGMDLGMLALLILHVVAWAVTVTMLTRLTVTTVGDKQDRDS